MAQLISRGAGMVLCLTMLACGGDAPKGTAPPPTERTGEARPSGNGACGLLMQSEVDELFGTAMGAGVDETLDGGVEICSWPSKEDAALLLQIAPGSADVRAAVALGDGYEVVDVADMSGSAAAAIEQADGPGAVLVLALAAGDRTITISPVGLGIVRDSPRFAALKELVDQIATR